MSQVVLRDGKNKSPVADEYSRNRFEGLAGRRKKLIEEGVPEKKLQQDRNILQYLNVDSCYFGNHPVARKSGNADDGSQNNRYDNADKRNFQRIQNADDQGPPVGVSSRIVNHRLADFKSRLFVQELEPGGNVLACKVCQGIGTQIITHQQHDTQRDGLENDGPFIRIMPESGFVCYRLLAGSHCILLSISELIIQGTVPAGYS